MTITKKQIKELPHRLAMKKGGIVNTHVTPKQFKAEIIALEEAYENCDESDEATLKTLENESKAYGVELMKYINARESTAGKKKGDSEEEIQKRVQEALDNKQKEADAAEAKRKQDEADAIEAKKKEDADAEAARLEEEEKKKTATPLSKEQKITNIIEFVKDKGQATSEELLALGITNIEAEDLEISLDDSHKLIKNGDVYVLAEKGGDGDWILILGGLVITGVLAFFGIKWYKNRNK